jgi:hypothetical protein
VDTPGGCTTFGRHVAVVISWMRGCEQRRLNGGSGKRRSEEIAHLPARSGNVLPRPDRATSAGCARPPSATQSFSGLLLFLLGLALLFERLAGLLGSGLAGRLVGHVSHLPYSGRTPVVVPPEQPRCSWSSDGPGQHESDEDIYLPRISRARSMCQILVCAISHSFERVSCHSVGMWCTPLGLSVWVPQRRHTAIRPFVSGAWCSSRRVPAWAAPAVTMNLPSTAGFSRADGEPEGAQSGPDSGQLVLPSTLCPSDQRRAASGRPDPAELI